jgi:allophycocyanin-B
MNGLSDRAKQLIPQARIVSFAGWDGLDSSVLARFQAADDEGRYLSDEDLQAIAPISPAAAIKVVQQLRDQAPEIVDEARAIVLDRFPGILEPGGGLYPPFRADACWRDFWHFLRCITYGIAGARSEYTSPAGLAAMEQLYDELKVPLPAMVEGLKGIKKASFNRFSAEDQAALAPYFDHLIARLSAYAD